MAILDRKPQEKPTPSQVKKPDEVKVTPPDYRGSTVDTRYVDRKDLMTHVSGSRWVVNYFAQMLGGNDELSHQQLVKDAVYQQYTQIQNLEIRVTSPLSGNQRDTGNSFDMTGTATTYPPLVPNTGDVFLADIGDGREGVLSVTASHRQSMLKESVFEIEYVLVSYASEEYRDDLAKKTVKQTRFIKDLIGHGKDPIVVEEDYYRLLDAASHEGRLLNQYFATFYDKTIGSISVPDQTHITYDPFLVGGLKQFLDTDEHPLARSMKLYSAEIAQRDLPYTFWDALMALSMAELPLCHEKLALIDARCFGHIPQYQGIAFSKVDDVVYPVDRNNVDLLHKDFSQGQVSARDIRHQFRRTHLGSLEQLNSPKGEGMESLYQIHPVTKDDYYVFSEAFYFHHHTEQSQLETIVRRVMEGGPVERDVLLALCDSAHRWGSLERFYYIPILLVLLKLLRQGG